MIRSQVLYPLSYGRAMAGGLESDERPLHSDWACGSADGTAPSNPTAASPQSHGREPFDRQREPALDYARDAAMSRIGPLEPRPVELRPRLSVDQLLWVANTRHGPGGHWFARPVPGEPDHDHLDAADDAVDYLVRHRVTLPKGLPTPKQLRRLAEIREMIRGLLDADEPAWTPEVRRTLKRTRFRLTAGGEIVSPDKGWDAFLEDLLPPLMQLLSDRERLRVCGNPQCGLVFLDLSKNGSRRWCDTAGCGNRERVRRYRREAATARAG